MKLTPAYISSTIQDSSTAKSLILRSKCITHIDDISYCVNLTKIDLSENEMRSGEALSGLKYCKGVTWISVAKNHLNDISNLTNLKSLQGKKDTDILRFILIIPFFVVLNASYNELSELPWDSLLELSSLKALILNNNNFTFFPPTATLPKSLDTLVLSHNPLKELPKQMLRTLPILTKLSCSNAQLHHVPDLSLCAEPKEVRLASNKLSTLTDIDRLLPLTIEIIDIGHNLIRKRTELQKLFVFKKLTSLNVRGNLSPEEDEEFFKTAQKELPLLRNFNGRSLQPTKQKKTAEFRLKPERQNRNIKMKFEEDGQ